MLAADASKHLHSKHLVWFLWDTRTHDCNYDCTQDHSNKMIRSHSYEAKASKHVKRKANGKGKVEVDGRVEMVWRVEVG